MHVGGELTDKLKEIGFWRAEAVRDRNHKPDFTLIVCEIQRGNFLIIPSKKLVDLELEPFQNPDFP